MSSIESIAFTAMSGDLLRLQVSAQNMANMNTAGYRSQHAVVGGVGSFQHHLMASSHTGTASANTTLGPENFKSTGSQQDAAILGPGYFKILDGESVLLTRRGQFALNTAGQLSIGGLAVAAVSGVIQPLSSEFRISGTGEVIDTDGEVLGRLELYKPTSEAKFSYLGRGIYQLQGSTERIESSSVALRPGFVEGSDVNPAREMIATSESVRHFGLAKDVLAANDQMLAAVADAMRSMGR